MPNINLPESTFSVCLMPVCLSDTLTFGSLNYSGIKVH